MDQGRQLSRLTIGLHWLLALAITVLAAMGLAMVNTPVWSYYPLHKSLGVLVFAVVLLRVGWRVRNGWPQPVRAYPPLEHLLAKAVHWVLIACTVALPLSGMLYSGASGHGFGVFGLTLVPSHHDAADASGVSPHSVFWSDTGQALHHAIGYLLMAALALHVAGALKHHLLDRDDTLRRMLGKRLGA